MKRWDPNWKNLPPVEPYRGPPLAPVVFTPEEMLRRRRDYRLNHERHATHVIPVVHGSPKSEGTP